MSITLVCCMAHCCSCIAASTPSEVQAGQPPDAAETRRHKAVVVTGGWQCTCLIEGEGCNAALFNMQPQSSSRFCFQGRQHVAVDASASCDDLVQVTRSRLIVLKIPPKIRIQHNQCVKCVPRFWRRCWRCRAVPRRRSQRRSCTRELRSCSGRQIRWRGERCRGRRRRSTPASRRRRRLLSTAPARRIASSRWSPPSRWLAHVLVGPQLAPFELFHFRVCASDGAPQRRRRPDFDLPVSGSNPR